jgi:radical SAM superfamily enzyme YgiQ (UPF0313 family)
MRQPLLLINPWIYDCAAYDFFARPLGLLYLAGLLEARGFAVNFLDCLGGPPGSPGPFGTGRYPKEILPTPRPLQGLPRRYGRYGISPAEFEAQLSRLPQPGAILVTSLMTYWYPGVVEAIRLARRHFPGTPVILGGIYATLCPEHARQHSGADLVLTGPGEEAVISHLAGLGLDWRADPIPADLDSLPYPALHLAPHLSFIPILTSRGCPLDCSYCASRRLQPTFRQRRPLAVVAELGHWQERLGLTEVAFYDDALLVHPADHLLVILEELAQRGWSFRFHTPNGLHARLISREVAFSLKRAPFATLRLGVETAAPGQARLDRKLQEGELEMALANLREAGFRPHEIGVYLLVGLPYQEEAEIAASIRRVQALGGTPILAQYSPIPGTALWPQAVQCSRYDLESDPLYHNNSLFPCLPQFSWDRYTRLKRLAGGT